MIMFKIIIISIIHNASTNTALNFISNINLYG